LIPSIFLHLTAGVVAGLLFTVPTLILLVSIVLIEVLVLLIGYGGMAAVGPLLGLVALQLGYVTGIFVRKRIDPVSFSSPRFPTELFR
jgi:hypothetical protein